jgi:hydroxypyruvate reductase
MIENRSALVGTPARELALDCVRAGIEAARPQRVVREAVAIGDSGRKVTVASETYDLDEYEQVVVLGGGKAAVGVAAALESVLGDRIDRGAVVTDAPADGPTGADASLDRVTVHEGDHPVPSERGVAGARRVLELADAADAETLVLAVVTGGASALLPAPADGISLADLRAVTTDLLESGATIHETNAVRKHCSALKGGRLAERLAPATTVGLVLSDVVGNDLGTIASGPLSTDESTFGDALAVLDRYDIDAPAPVRERLERGRRAAEGDGRTDVPETPTASDSAFERVSVHVLADAVTALDAAAAVARERGFEPLLLSSRIRGEAREAAKTHAAIAEEIRATGNPVEPPAVVLSGGETTVTVRGDGDGVFGSEATHGSSREQRERDGGPNLEFALSAALELGSGDWNAATVALASVDTDGRDGGTEVAGALVDGETVGGRMSEASAREALAHNDSLGVLTGNEIDCVIPTGPTGTNVNDLRVLVVGERSGNSSSDGRN